MEKLGNVIRSCHDLSFSEKKDTCSHDISCHDIHVIGSCHDIHGQRISLNDYRYLVETLESWRVFYPKAQIKKYGAVNCWEAMNRTKSMNPRVPGAYFTTTVRDLAQGEPKKVQEKPVEKIEVGKPVAEVQQKPSKSDATLPVMKSFVSKPVTYMDSIENWSTKQAHDFISNLHDKDLENPKTFELYRRVCKRFGY